MNQELKPCPFCGEIPSLRQMKSTKQYYLFCRKCNIETTSFNDREEIIKYWNTRFNETNYENGVTEYQQMQANLPCNIGDTAYCVNGYENKYIETFTVAEIVIRKEGIYLIDTNGMEWLARVCHFSRESAEKELNGEA